MFNGYFSSDLIAVEGTVVYKSCSKYLLDNYYVQTSSNFGTNMHTIVGAGEEAILIMDFP